MTKEDLEKEVEELEFRIKNLEEENISLESKLKTVKRNAKLYCEVVKFMIERGLEAHEQER